MSLKDQLRTSYVDGIAAVAAHFIRQGQTPAAVEAFLASEFGVENPQAVIANAARARRPLGAYFGADTIKAMHDLLGVAARPRFQFLAGNAVHDIRTPAQAVAGRFVENGLAVIAGESGVGKTFIAVDLAMSLTTGASHWLGAKVAARPWRVAYAIPEGFGYFKYRLYAWKLRAAGASDDEWIDERAIDLPAGLAISQDRVRLLDDDSVAAFIDAASEATPNVVILDTWTRHGGPELDPGEMVHALENVDRIRTDLDALVIVVYHTPLTAVRLRGAQHIDQAADTVMLCTPKDDGAIDAAFEQRDLEPARLTIARRQVVLPWTDPDTGGRRTSCLVSLADRSEDSTRNRVRANARRGHEADIVGWVRLHPGVSPSDVVAGIGRNKSGVIAEINALVERGVLIAEDEAGRGAVTRRRLTVAPLPM